MEQTVVDTLAVGKGISDWGFMAVASAFYLTYSALLLGWLMRWLMKTMNGMIHEQRLYLQEIQRLQKQQIDLLERSLVWQRRAVERPRVKRVTTVQ